MSTNVYIIRKPCAHCGQSLAKPQHFAKLSNGGILLRIGLPYEAACDPDDNCHVPGDVKAWRAFIKRPDIESRDEYRVTATRPRCSAGYGGGLRGCGP